MVPDYVFVCLSTTEYREMAQLILCLGAGAILSLGAHFANRLTRDVADC